jgi:hypothetical protein
MKRTLRPVNRSRVTSHPSRLSAPQQALLTLLDSAGIEGIDPAGLLLSIRSAGFDDLTLDDVRGAFGLQTLALRGLAGFRGQRWYILRKGKEELSRG